MLNMIPKRFIRGEIIYCYSAYKVQLPVGLDADMHPQATVYINALLSKIILVHAGASIFDGA